jgi:phosphohistidine swiveling domain-containing protein
MGTRPDPVHQRSRSDVYWTTVNATEAIPGTTTPLTWSFYADATELALRETFALMGVLTSRDVALPSSLDERFIGVFHGHPAANLTRFRLMADLAPGGSGDALERQFFGTVRTGTAPVNSKRRYPVVAARMPIAMASVSKRVHGLRDEADHWWRATTATAPRPDDAHDRRLIRDGADMYRRVLAWHGVGTMLTQGLYDQLGRACAAAGHRGAELELVRGLDELEEGDVAADLWALAHDRLPRRAFIDRHGFHGPDEGELSATVWRERPALLDASVAAYARLTAAEHPARAQERSRADAAAAASRLFDAQTHVDAAKTRLLLRLARPLMALREVGRGGLVRALDGTRAATRRLGDALAAGGTLADREDVFFLTLDELCAPAPPADARELVAERRARHDRYLQTVLPDGWWGDPDLESGGGRVVYIARGPEDEPVRGAGGSPGTVSGIARVVQSAEQRDELEPGEILVCHTTDPGWVATMHLAAGLVIDVGGPLSHGAIVARELGIPCVIGTKDGTARLHTGDNLELDGAGGTVRILTAR